MPSGTYHSAMRPLGSARLSFVPGVASSGTTKSRNSMPSICFARRSSSLSSYSASALAPNVTPFAGPASRK